MNPSLKRRLFEEQPLARRSFLITPSRGADAEYDVYGMRANRGKATMATVSKPGEPGWLGNPEENRAVDAGGTMSRAQATSAFADEVAKRAKQREWQNAFLQLRGKKVGYYKPHEKDIHLHELQRYIHDTPRVYAGIGSRDTPEQVQRVMHDLAGKLEQRNWALRSGGAAGADTAFASGVADPTMKAIYLPGRSFNNLSAGTSGNYDATRLPGWREAMEMAQAHHPAFDSLKPSVRNLMARSSMQIMGPLMDRPAERVIAWAPGGYENTPPPPGAREGGTGQALRIARAKGIPVVNLANPATMDKVLRFLDE